MAAEALAKTRSVCSGKTRVHRVVQIVFGYLLVGVVEVIEIFVGPPQLHLEWNPDLHKW